MKPKIISVCPSCKPTLDDQLGVAEDLSCQLADAWRRLDDMKAERDKYQGYHSGLAALYHKQRQAVGALMHVIGVMVGANQHINSGQPDLQTEVQKAKAAILDMLSVEGMRSPGITQQQLEGALDFARHDREAMEAQNNAQRWQGGKLP